MRRKAFLNLGVLTSAAVLPLLRRPLAAQPVPTPSPGPAPVAGAPTASQQVKGPAADPNSNAMLAAVVNEQFVPMKETLYQHAPAIDVSARTYYYDCVGFVTYTLSLAAPNAHDAVYAAMNVRKGYIPTPAQYVQWISGLPTAPHESWEMVPTMAALQAGDVLA